MILTILEDATVGTLVVVEEVPIPVVQQYVQHLYQPVKGTRDNHIYVYTFYLLYQYFILTYWEGKMMESKKSHTLHTF